MLITKSEKKEEAEGIELLNKESKRTLEEKENNKRLEILEAGIIRIREGRNIKKRMPQKNKKKASPN